MYLSYYNDLSKREIVKYEILQYYRKSSNMNRRLLKSKAYSSRTIKSYTNQIIYNRENIESIMNDKISNR